MRKVKLVLFFISILGFLIAQLAVAQSERRLKQDLGIPSDVLLAS